MQPASKRTYQSHGFQPIKKYLEKRQQKRNGWMDRPHFCEQTLHNRSCRKALDIFILVGQGLSFSWPLSAISVHSVTQLMLMTGQVAALLAVPPPMHLKEIVRIVYGLGDKAQGRWYSNKEHGPPLLKPVLNEYSTKVYQFGQITGVSLQCYQKKKKTIDLFPYKERANTLSPFVICIKQNDKISHSQSLSLPPALSPSTLFCRLSFFGLICENTAAPSTVHILTLLIQMKLLLCHTCIFNLDFCAYKKDVVLFVSAIKVWRNNVYLKGCSETQKNEEREAFVQW
ncbi:hypothetical protein JZ751_026475, partial [Albula glossodonta]